MIRFKATGRNQLNQSFFEKNTEEVAKELLGKVIEHKSPQGTFTAIINETEAYTQDESACHAFLGKTKRNRAMFEEAGRIYIYNSYGLHRCINFITEKAGKGCGVLLRGVICLSGSEYLQGRAKNINKLLDGPGKLVKSMQIPMNYYGMSLFDDSCPIKIYDDGYSPKDPEKTKRIGISKAKDLKWRFVANKFSR